MTSVLLLTMALLGADPVASGSQATSILSRRCVECHGSSKQSGKLRLDSVDAMFRGGKSGPAIVAGKSAESRLFERVRAQGKKRMPPEDEGPPLSAGELKVLQAWIDAGAKANAARTASSARVELGPLPESLQPVTCVAGDLSGARIAVGRGGRVEVLSAAPALNEKGSPKEGEKAARAGRTLKTIDGAGDLVQSLAFSPDGKSLAVGGFCVARIYKGDGFELKHTLECPPDRVVALAFSPDGSRLAVGGGTPTSSGEVWLFDVETGKQLWRITPHTDAVYALAFLPDGKRLWTGAADRVDFLLDAADGRTLQRFEGHTHHVLAASASPDGKRTVTTSADRTARVWDLGGGEPQRLRGHDGAVTSAHFVRDGKRVLTTSADGSVRLWNPENGNQDGSLGDTRSWVAGGALLDGGKLFAAAEESGAVRVWDIEKRKLLLTIE